MFNKKRAYSDVGNSLISRQSRRVWQGLQYAAITGFVLATAACSSWLQPKVEAEVSQLQPGQYQLDPNHAALIFKIQHLGLSTFVGRFNQLQASLDFDPDNISNTRLDAQVMIESIDVNNQELAETLRGGGWFDAAQFPVATFTTESVQSGEAESFDFTGLLTLHGVTRPVTLAVQFHGGADNWLTGKYTLGFSATGQIKRSDFAIDSFIPLVGDEVELEVYAEFQRN